ncbi:MAG: hypothetical protein FJ386_15435, partial [Verrucomicrobia bacterium]|nr:hypothetical protein [Verrucomicrobiota bacterium]
MKINPWTVGLAAAGVISFAGTAQAEEAKNQVMTAVSGTTLSGYVSTSARWDFSSAAGVSAYRFGAGKADGFNLDVVNVTVAKAPGEGEWASGYKAEMVFGPDANAGLGGGFGLKQAYVALRAPVGNGLDIKMGVFDSVIGYEATNSPDNPNYTRSWGNTIDPVQHTGILASYRFCENFSGSIGVANTALGNINARNGSAQSQKTYMAAISATAPESFGALKGTVLNAGVVDAQSNGAANDITYIYVGATIPTPMENLTVGLAWDHHMQNAATDAQVLAAYVSYKASDKLKVNVRADYLDNN